MPCKNCGRSTVSPSGAVNEAHIQTAETTEVRSWTSLPLLDVANVPEDLDLIGGSNSKYQSWRIPASYFLPGGTLNNNQYKVSGTVTIGDRQVLPVCFSANGDAGILVADGRTATLSFATDIAVASADGVTTIMKSGYYTFARPHAYIVGKTYYLSTSAAGEVVSVKPTNNAQPLFSVVNQTTISINVALQ